MRDLTGPLDLAHGRTGFGPTNMGEAKARTGSARIAPRSICLIGSICLI
ncbi:hypothetical protein [Cypionkella sp.]|nr:hypothetical protein [Cypionkella sp.]